MLSTTLITALAATIPLANAHFTFVRIALNGEWQEPLKYIRNKTSPYLDQSTPNQNWNQIREYNFPTYPSDRPESVRCGRDSFSHANLTDVLKVHAGDTMEWVATRFDPWQWKPEQWNNCPGGKGMCNPGEDPSWGTDNSQESLQHIGPLTVHLSPVPKGVDVKEYDGSGEWVKIHTVGLEIRKDEPSAYNRVWWIPFNGRKPAPRMPFTLPKQTPAGQYLLRVDLVVPGTYNTWTDPATGEVEHFEGQIYPACAQIEVVSDSATPFPKGIKIPEGVCWNCTGQLWNNSTPLPGAETSGVDPNYVYPGGPLWDGETLVQDKPPQWDGLH